MEGGASPAPPPAPPSPPGHVFLGVRLRRGVVSGRRDGGTSTPVPTWRLLDHRCGGGEKGSSLARPSARKLAAGLWELHRREPARTSGGGRRRRRRTEKAVDGTEDRVLGGPSSNSPAADQLLNASSLRRRHVTASYMEHSQRTAAKNNRPLKSISQASNGSSMKIAAYDPPFTSSSFVGFKGRLTETGYGLKTSTELLKVLNRVWTLEEQLSSNVAMVRELNIELDLSQWRIQEMMHKHQADRKEIDELVNKLIKIKGRRTKEKEKIKAVIQSLKDELHEEKNLRRLSEGFHRKLAKKLVEVNASFSNALKELEEEWIGRAFLEQLCDEFGKALRFYGKDLRRMDFSGTEDDDLILLIAEAWLHEREQVKQAEAGIEGGRETSVYHLKRELVEFFKTKQGAPTKNEGPSSKYSKGDCLRRASLESIHLNGAHSAPQDAGDEDSLVSDFHHLNLNNAYEGKEVIRDISDGLLESGIQDSELAKPKRLDSRSKMKGCSFQQPQSNKLVEQRISPEDGKNKLGTTCGRTHETGDMSGSNRPIFSELNGPLEDDGKKIVGIGCLSGEEHSTMTFGNDFLGADFGVPSPVQQWRLHQDSPDTIQSEFSSGGMKGSTLKEKLLEARLEGQNARLKSSKLYK